MAPAEAAPYSPRMNGRSRQWPAAREEAERFAASNLFAFLLWLRLARGRRLVDRAALERWEQEDPGGFAEAFWDFAGVIGERGQGLCVAENVLRYGGAREAVAGAGGHVFSRERLCGETAARAAAYRAAGIGPGDAVGGWVPDDPESIASFLGANAVGAVWACEPSAARFRVAKGEVAAAQRGAPLGFVRRPLAAPLAILADGLVARQEAFLACLRDILLRAEVRPDQRIVPNREPGWVWGIAALATGASVVLG
ncbi:MAG TPA: hypothetical protein VMF62_05230 [Acetobacteraceae bacterium]|nr:hypothetical protein [Acetobacteraceae bacterium]